MLSLIVSMFIFSLSMSISPGPVNLTILTSSMNYGVKATFAFISGATIVLPCYWHRSVLVCIK